MRRGAPRKEVRLSKENITPGKARNITFVRRHSRHRILSPKALMNLFGDSTKRRQHKFCAAERVDKPIFGGFAKTKASLV